MRALTVADGRLTLRDDYLRPEPAQGEVLLKVLLAGICSTDLEIVRGYTPFKGVLGHEFVGWVESAASDVDPGWIGRRVVSAINLGCGSCAVCLASGPEHCPDRTVLGIHDRDGAFADFVAVPAGNLLQVPDDVPDEAAVFTEPLAAALRIREQVAVRPSARTAVVGPGRLGLLVGQVLALDGTDVTLLGRSQASLKLPMALGMPAALVHDIPDNSFELVVEATGNNRGFAHSLRLVRPEGTLILKSTFAGNSELDLTKLVVGEITVIGSRCGPFAPAMRLLQTGAVNVAATVDAEYGLQDGLAAFEYAARPGVRKVLLRP